MSSCFCQFASRERFRANAFFPARREPINRAGRHVFALITHLLSIRATASWKMLMVNKYKADTPTGNPTGNWRCQVLAPRAFVTNQLRCMHGCVSYSCGPKLAKPCSVALCQSICQSQSFQVSKALHDKLLPKQSGPDPQHSAGEQSPACILVNN